MNEPTIWAFLSPDSAEKRRLVYRSIKSGKSRFGWSSDDERNLLTLDPSEWGELEYKYSHRRLLEIDPGDWIVHINLPEKGKCVAAEVLSKYRFDEGLDCGDHVDFKHCFEVNAKGVVEFDRDDDAVLPSVHLRQRKRIERIYNVDDFLQSIASLRDGVSVNLGPDEGRGEYHLKDKTDEFLPRISEIVREMHHSKNLEGFLAKVFRKIPGVVEVEENGLKGGPDHGADLIVHVRTPMGHLPLQHTVIVQIKSFEGTMYGPNAVDDVVAGIKQYDGTEGMIMTTAEKHDSVDNAIAEASRKINKPIDVLASDDVARFVIKHAPEMVFNLKGVS